MLTSAAGRSVPLSDTSILKSEFYQPWVRRSSSAMTCRDPDRPSDPIGRTFNRSSPADARQHGGGGLHRRDSCGL